MTSLTNLERFYDDQRIRLPAYLRGDTITQFGLGSKVGGLIVPDVVEVNLPADKADITSEEVMDKIQDMAWAVLEHQGSQFEVAVLNYDNDQGAMLNLPANNTSISGSPSTAYEFAYHALCHPTIPLVHVALPGSGDSSFLTRAERRHLHQTGRLTWDNENRVEPLPTFRHLVGALEDRGLTITRLGSEALGSAVAVAVGAALKENQLTHAAFYAHPQIAQARKSSFFNGLISRQANNDNDYLGASTNLAITSWREKEIINSRPDIYEPSLTNNDVLAWLSLFSKKADILPRAIGDQNAFVQDLNAYCRRQLQAKTNFILAESDPLWLRDGQIGITKLMETVKRTDFLRFIAVSGISKTFHQRHPGFYRAIQSKLLELP